MYMLSEDEEGLLPYQGEILEMNLSEWVLRNSAPSMGELTFAQPAGTLSSGLEYKYMLSQLLDGNNAFF